MPQYNRNDLEIAARNQHFTRDTFEKVLRLKTILDWMNVHEFLKAHLLLKGGTAIFSGLLLPIDLPLPESKSIFTGCSILLEIVSSGNIFDADCTGITGVKQQAGLQVLFPALQNP